MVMDMIVLELVAMNTPTEEATAENTFVDSRGCNGVKKDEAMGDILADCLDVRQWSW